MQHVCAGAFDLDERTHTQTDTHTHTEIRLFRLHDDINDDARCVSRMCARFEGSLLCGIVVVVVVSQLRSVARVGACGPVKCAIAVQAAAAAVAQSQRDSAAAASSATYFTCRLRRALDQKTTATPHADTAKTTAATAFRGLWAAA